MNETIEVNLLKNKKLSASKNLPWPQKYEDFIKDIKEKFKVKKNSNVILTLITRDDDDSPIESQDDLDQYLEEDIIKKFNIEITEKEEPEPDPIPIPSPVPLDILEINIDEIIKEVFDNDAYKKELEINNKQLSDNFKSNLELSINNIIDEKQKVLVNDIDSKLKIFEDDLSKNQKENKNLVVEIKDEIIDIKDHINEMSSAILDLKDNFKPAPKPIPIKMIKFEEKKIEKIIEMKDAKFININNINIINAGNVSFKNLYFIKEQENSSNDLRFFGNSRATNEYEISMPGELKPKQSFPCTVTMNINNPQAGQEYKIIIYAKENKKIIVSDPFEIIIKINNPKEDPMKQKQMKASQIYEEIKDQFAAQADEDLINKEDIINRLLQNNLNKDEIVNDINNKIKEKEQRENNEKAERIFGQLNMDNINLDKKEVLDYIKENQFNTEIVQKWIDDKKPKQEPASPQNPANDEIKQKIDEIYNDLEEEYGISGFLEEDAAKDKIKEFKLDKEAIVQWIENALINGN